MFASTQLVELFVVLWTANQFFSGFYRVRSAFLCAQAKSGPVRPDTVPCGTLFSALQLLNWFFVPLVYMLTVIGNGLQQPSWMNTFALPEVASGAGYQGELWKSLLRLLPCLAGILTQRISESAFNHLGDQYHPIGRREKPRVVQTGPYAWVRHPLYALALVHGVLQCIMFWSWFPLLSLVIAAGTFAYKLQIEEEVIQRDVGIREEYRAYMRKVPARLVPYVW